MSSDIDVRVKVLCNELESILELETADVASSALSRLLICGIIRGGESREVFIREMRIAWDHYERVRNNYKLKYK